MNISDNEKELNKSGWEILTEFPIWLVFLFFLFVAWLPFVIFMFNASFGNQTETTGQIGDTVGGLTAPILGLLNAILVYAAFRQQIAVNKFQFNAHLEQLREMQRGNQAQIDAVSHQKEIYQSEAQQQLFLALGEVIAQNRETTKFRFEDIKETYYYGSQAIVWRCHKISNNGTSFEIQDFLKKIEPIDSLMLGISILQYQAFLDLVSKFCKKLDDSNLTLEQKQIQMLYLQKIAPFVEMILSDFAYFRNIIRSDDISKTIQDLENYIKIISNKYSLESSPITPNPA